MNEVCKVRHLKKILENFRNLIFQERYVLEFYSKALIVSILNMSLIIFISKIGFLRRSLFQIFAILAKRKIAKIVVYMIKPTA